MMHEWVTMDGFHPLITHDPSGSFVESLSLNPVSTTLSGFEKKDTSQRLQAILNMRRRKNAPDAYPRSNSSLDLRMMDVDPIPPGEDLYSSQMNIPTLDNLSSSSLSYHRKGGSTLSQDCEFCLDRSSSQTPPVLCEHKCRRSTPFLSRSTSPTHSISPEQRITLEKPPLPPRLDHPSIGYFVGEQQRYTPHCNSFRRLDANDIADYHDDMDVTSSHVLIGRGAVSAHYESIQILRQSTKQETSITDYADRYVKKLENSRFS